MQKDKDFIFGFRAIMEAITSGKEIDKLLIKKGLKGELYFELMELVKKFVIPYQFVPIEKIDSITRKNHQGVVALMSPIEFSNIEQIVPSLFEQGATPLLLVLDAISDVRNFGAIVRTAECAGVHAVIIPLKGMARISSDSVKTSAGALLRVPICRTQNMEETIKFLQGSGLQVVAATEKADEYYYNQDLTIPTAIIMGSEDKGIDYEFLKVADKMVRIPILGKIDSLNVSVAASVIVYEAVRQRQII